MLPRCTVAVYVLQCTNALRATNPRSTAAPPIFSRTSRASSYRSLRSGSRSDPRRQSRRGATTGATLMLDLPRDDRIPCNSLPCACLSRVLPAISPPTKRCVPSRCSVEVLGALASVLLIWLLTGVLVYEAVLRIINPEPVDGVIMFITACECWSRRGVKTSLMWRGTGFTAATCCTCPSPTTLSHRIIMQPAASSLISP